MRLARRLAAAGAADDLREQLERPLGRAKIRQAEADVGRDDADERHRRKVVALRDHLRADEDVDRRRAATSRSTRAIAPRRRIVSRSTRAIARRRETARADRPRAARCRSPPARGTRRRSAASARHRRRVVAVVAAHPPLRAVVRQRHAAVRALDRRAALPAEHHASRSRAGSAARRVCSRLASRSLDRLDERRADRRRRRRARRTPGACRRCARAASGRSRTRRVSRTMS